MKGTLVKLINSERSPSSSCLSTELSYFQQKLEMKLRDLTLPEYFKALYLVEGQHHACNNTGRLVQSLGQESLRKMATPLIFLPGRYTADRRTW